MKITDKFEILGFRRENRISILFFNVIVLIITIIFLQMNVYGQLVNDENDTFLGGSSGDEIFRYFDTYWSQMTPGNAGKWGSVEYSQGQYNWSSLDKLYNYCIGRGLLFKQHTFVWGNQQPGWLSSLDSAAQYQAVENWIKNFAERYPETALVDVVNEPLHAEPSYMSALGGSGETGWDWVIKSFEMARANFGEGTKLILNEYNVIHSSSTTTQYLEIINLLKERGLIDGIGIQGHYFEFRSDIGSSNTYVYSISTLKSNLDRLAETGLDIYITEFDIDEPDDQNQLDQYKIYFPLFWNHPSIKGITFWGFWDWDIWTSHPNTFLIENQRDERPAMEWLKEYVKLPKIPLLIAPALNDSTNRNPVILWQKSSLATSYNLQISSDRNFTTTTIDTIIIDTSFTVEQPLDPNMKYYWKVSAVNEFGSSEYSIRNYFTTTDEIVNVKNEKIVNDYKLYQNYPNPFNPSTNIQYLIPRKSQVSLKIYDVIGNELYTLVQGEKTAGMHSVNFNAGSFPSGVYFYKFQTEESVLVKKLMLLK